MPLWQDSNFVQILCSSDFLPRALTHAVPAVAFDGDSTTSFVRVGYFKKKMFSIFFHHLKSSFQGKSRYLCRIILNHILPVFLIRNTWQQLYNATILHKFAQRPQRSLIAQYNLDAYKQSNFLKMVKNCISAFELLYYCNIFFDAKVYIDSTFMLTLVLNHYSL